MAKTHKSLRIHFVENGAAGGRQKESASIIQAFAATYVRNEWAYTLMLLATIFDGLVEGAIPHDERRVELHGELD
ncbi:hypothetical protein GN958_ATG08107 [Phytophthora infestans]|uniref:Uncharacterized protein n=1 Tax=Phytophthora infestans TaxID=4787 RepID=A0A8S9UPD1_PHYIN|nr:hypothetical protein GN958_ATG08107 [Phytophthora infestans]